MKDVDNAFYLFSLILQSKTHIYRQNKTKTRNQVININNNNNNNNSVAHLLNAFHLYISTNLLCDVFSAASGLSLNVEETKQISDSRTHVSI